MTTDAKTASARDAAYELARDTYNQKQDSIFNDHDFHSGFKAGWDARDELLLKLHGEGAMAEVIQLQREVSTLKHELDATEKVYRMNREYVEQAKEEVKRLRVALEEISEMVNETAMADLAAEALAATDRKGE